MDRSMKKLFTQFGAFLVVCTIALQVVAAPITAFADTQEGGGGDPPPAPTEINLSKYLRAEGQTYTVGGSEQKITIGSYIVRLVNFLSLVIGSFAFLAIVIGGIVFVASAGNETSLQKGKDIIKYSVIGLVVALTAYFITGFVQSIFFEYG